MSSIIPDAVLLLGPTGSGKTPFGELIEKEGLSGKKCFHFDFGSRLRTYAQALTGILSPDELEVLKNSLRTGTLLTDDEFPIARKLLQLFIEENCVERDSLIVMNGLPRHAGQAAALEKIINIMAVIVLECDAATVLERIRTDAGGDRGGRVDDTIEAVTQKLAIFSKKTLPLVDFYRRRGVPVIHARVGPCSSAEDIRSGLIGRIPK